MTSKRLARLVRLKKLAEQAQAVELEEQRRALDEAKGRLSAVHDAMDAAEGSLEAGSSAADLVQVAAYRDHLSEQAKQSRAEVAQKAASVRDQEGEVRSAWQDRRLLEGVHGRAVEREAVETNAKDHKAMEAIALSRYGRGND